MAFLLRRLVKIAFTCRKPLLLAAAGCSTGVIANGIMFRRRRLLCWDEDYINRFDFGAEMIEVDPNKKAGLKIVSIRPESLADRNNFEEGDVIINLEGNEIGNFDDYKWALGHAERRTIVFTVLRGIHTIQIQVRRY